jgi:hypothetical protein
LESPLQTSIVSQVDVVGNLLRAVHQPEPTGIPRQELLAKRGFDFGKMLIATVVTVLQAGKPIGCRQRSRANRSTAP